jgi:TonB family protein
MRTFAIFMLLLFSVGLSVAQNPEGNVPVCDPTTTKPEEVSSDKYAEEVRGYVRDIVVPKIRTYWYSVVPIEASAPLLRQGCLKVQFEILRNGGVRALKYVTSSGNVAMDRAAFGAVAGSSPFPPLPNAFKGEQLHLKFGFFYNPGFHPESPYAASVTFSRTTTPDLVHTIPLDTLSAARVLHVVKPEYPKQALRKKIQGAVTLNATVDQNGKVISVSVLSGEAILSHAAEDAVKNWTFEPFMKSGHSVQVQQVVKIEFALGFKTGEPDFAFAPATLLQEKENIQPQVPAGPAASIQ